MCWIRGRSSACEGWNAVSHKWGTWQCHTTLYSIYQYQIDQHSNNGQWYWRGALRILCRLEKSYHYCFTHEVNIITDDNPLVVIFKKDIATLSRRLWKILMCIHQYNIKILHKPVQQLYISDGCQGKTTAKTKMKRFWGWNWTQCYGVVYRHPRMHDSWGNLVFDARWQPPNCPDNPCYTWMVINKGRDK